MDLDLDLKLKSQEAQLRAGDRDSRRLLVDCGREN